MQRITSQISTRVALEGIRTQSSRLASAQSQLSSGRRVQKPSDDPIAFRSISNLRAEVRRLDSELQSIERARGALNGSVSRLTEARTLLVSAQTAAQQARDPLARETHAKTVDSVLEQMVRLANEQANGRYVFGGAQPNQPPVQAERDASGRIIAVDFVGSDQPSTTPIGTSFTVDVSTPAKQIFGGLPGARQGELSIISRTGIQPGAGADSSRASGEILVTHTSTSFGGASGVAAGASSSGGDTILGPLGANTLTIVDESGTGAFGTVSLNGGPPVSFTNADTDLQVAGANGELAHLDMSGIAAGFNGDVDILANGNVSIDGGATSVPIDFSSNQQLVHGATGAALNVDTSNVTRTGVDLYDHPGAANLFDAMIALRDDLLNKRGTSESEYQEQVTLHLGELERLGDHLLDHVGEQSVMLENLDSSQTLAEDIRLETKVSQSRLEDVDATAVILDLQAAQSVLETTYAATAAIFNSSFLDYL